MTPELTAAVDRELARRGGGSRRPGAKALSGHYRAGGRSDAQLDLAAYVTVRMPATYAAVARVLAEVLALRPDFAPGSLLDAGSGPGTASWAAIAAWPDLARIVMADSNSAFLALAGQLAAASSHPALASARHIEGEFQRLPGDCRASLVIAAYALAEVPEPGIPQSVDALWRAAEDMLVLVEPGTPRGFARLRVARNRLLAAGAVPVAPCTHAAACPMAGDDWCHFSVRLPRRREHMHAKNAQVPFEDEPFTYLAVSRTGSVAGGARILAPRHDAKPGVTFKLCTERGVELHHVARRDAPLYKQSRKLQWGDVIASEG